MSSQLSSWKQFLWLWWSKVCNVQNAINLYQEYGIPLIHNKIMMKVPAQILAYPIATWHHTTITWALIRNWEFHNLSSPVRWVTLLSGVIIRKPVKQSKWQKEIIDTSQLFNKPINGSGEYQDIWDSWNVPFLVNLTITSANLTQYWCHVNAAAPLQFTLFEESNF